MMECGEEYTTDDYIARMVCEELRLPLDGKRSMVSLELRVVPNRGHSGVPR